MPRHIKPFRLAMAASPSSISTADRVAIAQLLAGSAHVRSQLEDAACTEGCEMAIDEGIF